MSPTPGPPDEADYTPLPLVDWVELYDDTRVDDALVTGLVFPGRWVQLVAAAKAGKSTLALHVATALARGRDPFTDTEREPVTVLFIDAEMGRLDVYERMVAARQTPADLARLHYTDMPTAADTLPGATAIVTAASILGAAVVVLDGLNGMVSGGENDDTTWRNLFTYAIGPLKRAGRAVLSTDNSGKDTGRGSRGSSVKTDKADAVFELRRTDDGLALKRTHTRTADACAEMVLKAEGLDGARALRFTTTTDSWPAGTRAAVELLDRLNVPVDIGRDRVRRLLKEHAEGVRDTALSAAIRYRKSRR